MNITKITDINGNELLGSTKINIDDVFIIHTKLEKYHCKIISRDNNGTYLVDITPIYLITS